MTLENRTINTKPRKQTISMQNYNEIANLFKGDKFVQDELKRIKPNSDASGLLIYLADMHENKELSEEQIKGIKNSKQLQRLLQVSIEYKKKVALDIETQSAVKGLLHFNKSAWLYREMSTAEIIKLADTPYIKIDKEIERLTKKYNRQTFEKVV